MTLKGWPSGSKSKFKKMKGTAAAKPRQHPATSKQLQLLLYALMVAMQTFGLTTAATSGPPANTQHPTNTPAPPPANTQHPANTTAPPPAITNIVHIPYDYFIQKVL
jgi:cytochrome b561